MTVLITFYVFPVHNTILFTLCVQTYDYEEYTILLIKNHLRSVSTPPPLTCPPTDTHTHKVQNFNIDKIVANLFNIDNFLLLNCDYINKNFNNKICIIVYYFFFEKKNA